MRINIILLCSVCSYTCVCTKYTYDVCVSYVHLNIFTRTHAHTHAHIHILEPVFIRYYRSTSASWRFCCVAALVYGSKWQIQQKQYKWNIIWIAKQRCQVIFQINNFKNRNFKLNLKQIKCKLKILVNDLYNKSYNQKQILNYSLRLCNRRI